MLHNFKFSRTSRKILFQLNIHKVSHGVSKVSIENLIKFNSLYAFFNKIKSKTTTKNDWIVQTKYQKKIGKIALIILEQSFKNLMRMNAFDRIACQKMIPQYARQDNWIPDKNFILLNKSPIMKIPAPSCPSLVSVFIQGGTHK